MKHTRMLELITWCKKKVNITCWYQIVKGLLYSSKYKIYKLYEIYAQQNVESRIEDLTN